MADVKKIPTMIKRRMNNQIETYCHHLQHNFHLRECTTLSAKN